MIRGAAARFPLWLYVPAALGVAVLALPLVALLVRLDWTQVPAAVASPAALQALTLSLVTAAIATAVCVVLGVPLAMVIARSSRGVAAVLRTLATLPLVLPPLVGGIALLALLGRNGLFGETLGRARPAHPVHDHRRRDRADVRRPAVPRDHGRGVAAHGGHALRDGRGRARRPPVHGVPAHHAAARRPRA